MSVDRLHTSIDHDAMSASFIAVVFLAAILLVNWRLVLLLIGACLIALIAFGIGAVKPESPVPSAPASSTQVGPVAPGNGEVGQPQPR
jgi:hypothetical protein